MAEGQANGSKPRDIEFYGGASRFELELEFVQSLSNPLYIQHLAAQKYLEDADFIRYLDYLQYFREPKYMKFLQYPGPTLRALELLQQEQFRRDAISPALVDQMVTSGFEAATAGLGR
ncbi:suppressor of hpr1 [Oleoguttula mirabilis]|uniref:Mediator of RNA polymerase II transcription subunit 31 n=1 Tax=Oleoguttula mirabilis TaxID=1507867 RepID=A0AAV9JU41_9PEZI|nr:suppressor of hpr1 [Oleoguttula mirabilis]